MNSSFKVGDRVRWLESAKHMRVGTVEPTGAGMPCVRPDGMSLTWFSPSGRDLFPECAPPLVFFYRNHRGDGSVRSVYPIDAWFGTTEHHSEPCWLLRAWCLESQVVRDFEMAKMIQPAVERDKETP